MNSIQAIETQYNGYRFRSRLEARWAVFFDALSVGYEYEKEGFDLDGLRYLPDFWLPEYRIWVEIKGEVSRKSDARKIVLQCGKLAYHTQCPVVLSEKDPWDVRTFIFTPVPPDGIRPVGAKMYARSFWGLCPQCGRLAIGIDTGKDTAVIMCPKNIEHRTNGLRAAPEHRADSFDQRLRDAATAARSARFEYGETPRVPRGSPRN